MYANIKIINEKRASIKGYGFFDDIWWSSREYSSEYGHLVNSNDGGIFYAPKDNSFEVLAFLAVEVSQLVN